LFSLKFAFAIIKAITPRQNPNAVAKNMHKQKEMLHKKKLARVFCCAAKRLFVNIIGLLFNLW
jgi:hypothetical protein